MPRQLPINSLDDFAEKIGLPKFLLTRYVFQADSYYKTFKIAKRSGNGYRAISAPSKELKGIQKWITMFVLRSVELSTAATGYRQGLSIKDNASAHIGKDFVCNMDLEDFFPSIAASRITAIFKSLGYPKSVSGALSRLTTYKGKLPQGAPSSPDLSNIVLRKLDYRLMRFCEKRSWSYTRYCDDLSISGSGGITEGVLAAIREIISDEGFRVNVHKTRVRRKNSRQSVTGLTVNQYPNLSLHRRKSIRAMFHQALLYPEKFRERLAELEGNLSYFKFLRPADTQAFARYEDAIERVRSSCKNSLS